ncbi:transcriptional regulator with XRE-family HTH domain [Roseateles asaccharophilus]|uniref:helix-turn-helix domain-containing protein n=1 Tax=Roseateles asaccharophilus TaxID=582607 RepID=UPI0038394535
MTDSALRRARKALKLTQTALADMVGTTQGTLARWEAGKAPIPDDKAELLTTILGAPIQPTKPRIEPVENEADEGDGSEYFGEVAIHFRSGGRPLVVSINEGARSRIYAQLDSQITSVLGFETTDNRSVYVRLAAISDLHFCSDDTSTVGPEEGSYGAPVRGISSTNELDLTDPEDDDDDPVDALLRRPIDQPAEFWRGIPMLEYDDGQVDVNVKAAVEAALESKFQKTYLLLSQYMFWQVEGSKRRGMRCNDDAELSDSLFALELGNVESDHRLQLVCGEDGGYHHSVIINFAALEYLTVPTHLLDASSDAAQERDALVA